MMYMQSTAETVSAQSHLYLADHHITQKTDSVMLY